MIKKFLLFILGGVLLFDQTLNAQEMTAALPQLKIAVGSKNQVKVQSVKNGCGHDSDIIPCAAESYVRAQPLSNEETLEGAINRAKDCLEKTEADLAIGLEAGILFLNEDIYLCHWGALVDRQGHVYFTNGPVILLPKDFKEALLAGESLENIMHQSTGIKGLGTKEGAIGVFTGNRLNRELVLTQMVKVLIGQYTYYQEK